MASGQSIGALARGLRVDEHGILRAAGQAVLSYPETGNDACYALEDRSYWFRHRNDCIAAVVRRFPPSGAILDIGGGNGYVTRRLLDEGFACALLEPGSAGAWNGRVKRGIPEVLCATLQDAALPPGRLSAAGCFDVIEHVEDDRTFLDAVRELLEPKGLLYATVPAYRWLWSKSDLDAGHFRRYDRRTFVALVNESGFDVMFASYFFWPLVLPVLVLHALPQRLWPQQPTGLLSSEARHGTGGGGAVRLLERLLRSEARRIAQGLPVPAGTSCLLVARRV